MEGSYYIMGVVRYTYGTRLFMISSGTVRSTVGGLATPRTGVSPRKKAASDLSGFSGLLGRPELISLKIVGLVLSVLLVSSYKFSYC